MGLKLLRSAPVSEMAYRMESLSSIMSHYNTQAVPPNSDADLYMRL